MQMIGDQKKILQPEILAPCGSEESVRAAVNCGADAVYLGQKAFNARQNADNFSGQAFKDIVSFCHLNGVKVYQTLNTLVFDSELSDLKLCVKNGCEAGVDAFIIQDMGVLQLVQEWAPKMPIHASTQMTIHTSAGVRFLEELGVKRVVLARELSLQEIHEIRQNCKAELEVFVHGALCVCMSGQCYMSGMLGGRSGNRGTCAQPCRLPFSVHGDGAADLSLRDLSAIPLLDQLAEAGVNSFKIEGRMKRPEYVAAAVTACVEKRNGKQPDLERLQAVFSRSGFTDGYLTAKRGREMFGVRQKEDVTAAAQVLAPLRNLYRSAYPRIPCKANFEMHTERKATLSLSDADGNVVKAEGEIPEIAREKATTLDSAKEYFSKMGGTPFYLSELTGTVEDHLMMPAKVLNAMRRDCVEQLTQKRSEIHEVKFIGTMPELPTALPKQKRAIRLRAETFEQITNLDTSELEWVILPLDEVLKQRNLPEQDKIIVELPRVSFDEKQLIARLVQLRNFGYDRILVQNPSHLLLGRELNFILHGGFGLNIINSYAAAFYQEQGLTDITLSFEMNLNQAKRIHRGVPIGVIAYGNLPLMITRSCPIGKYKNCSNCSGQETLTDRRGKRFAVRCQGEVREIYNPDTLYMADRMGDLDSFDFITLYFTGESPAETKRVIQEYISGSGTREHFTRGLYYRKV
ncbi:MAG: U32 family peptidase [Clostridiales bacterium]|nr:U32 family peptidase [Clostridiales bacterium]